MGLLDLLFGDPGADHAPARDCDCTPCTQRWQAAVHEAGHVLAYQAYGEEWESAEVTDDGEGRVRSAQDGADPTGIRIWNFLVIGQAGPVAENLWFGEFSGAGDAANVAELAAQWGDPDGVANAWDEAEDLISRHMDALESLADELFTDGIIYPN